MLGIVAMGVYSQEVPKIFRAPIYMAHCAVIFAIAQLSCLALWLLTLSSIRMGVKNTYGYRALSSAHCSVLVRRSRTAA